VTLFSVISDFFHFILFFFINNVQWWYKIYMSFFELWFFALFQQAFIKHIVYHPFFWKFQLRYSLANILWDSKKSVSFLVQLWGFVWMDIFCFQSHVVSSLQSLWIPSFLVKLSLHSFFCYLHQFFCFLLAFL